ncbi:MAG: SUMF1/EgtB/PvdO family nonheme iron enzyme, partial [Anaerolineales bacterium]|nr:SUMF1/EgtB/PvdO family nonheme iron enzyme [Anaerolineales bacterium]
MDSDSQKQLEELHQLREKGLLSEAAYQAAVAGIQVSYQATSESGAAAQGAGATAVGERGVLARDVGGSIITGDVYYGEPTQDPAEAIRIYCRVLAQSSGHLPLRGVDIGASDPASGHQPLGLANVYVDLDTTSKAYILRAGTGRFRMRVGDAAEDDAGDRPVDLGDDDREPIPIPALQKVTENKRLVLTGDPGGGKSTFVNHLAHCLAAHIWQPEVNWLEHLSGWPRGKSATIPLLVILRDFANSLPPPLPYRAEAQHLWDFIINRLTAQNLDFVAKPLAQALDAGHVLLLFDGLDEVATTAQRAFVRDAVLAFLNRYHPDNRALVTCRILSYQPPAESNEPDLRLPTADFPTFELAPFDEAKIDRFIAAWYAELARLGQVRPPDVDSLTGKLRTAVRRPDLWRLAGNPLLLTVMALVHTHKGRLPDARALLYEDTVDVLLWRWEQVKAGGQADAPQLRQLLLAAGLSDLDLKKALWQLAYEAHTELSGDHDEEALAGIGELKLKKMLVKLANDDWNWAHQIVQAMKLRAGLLLERSPGVFTFPHRTFQEYLAGAHLSVQRNFAREAADLARRGALWREVILLAVGRLVYLSGDTADKPLALVNRLCPVAAEDDDIAWRNAWLAGDVLLEMGLKWAQEDVWGRELLARVRDRLVALVARGRLTPRERAEAGSTLARLGDPRPGVCTLEPDLIPIPAGTFLMGDEKDEIILDAYAISRYPVTNAQFRYFVEDGGYTEKWRACWTDEGWQQRSEGSWIEPRFWDDERFNQANQPAVGVSWYEAVAYCNWLGRKTGQNCRLPTEAEWERAARHTDGREYPWGEEEPNQETTNFEATGLERPAAVGIFPADTAVCGAQDLAGNISEWCQTRWQNEDGTKYALPYRLDDGREDISGSWQAYRVWRGGTWP